MRSDVARVAHSFSQLRSDVETKIQTASITQNECLQLARDDIEDINGVITGLRMKLSEFSETTGQIEVIALRAQKKAHSNYSSLKHFKAQVEVYVKEAKHTIENNRISLGNSILDNRRLLDELSNYMKNELLEKQLSVWKSLNINNELYTQIQEHRAKAGNTQDLQIPRNQATESKSNKQPPQQEVSLEELNRKPDPNSFVPRKLDSLEQSIHSLTEDLATYKFAAASSLTSLSQTIHITLQENTTKTDNKFLELHDTLSAYQVQLQDSLGTKFSNQFQELSMSITEYKVASGQRKREISDLTEKFKTQSRETQTRCETIASLQDCVESLERTQKVLIECLYIDTQLESQDEVDREAVSLMGFKQKIHGQTPTKLRTHHRPVISLAKQCVSCTVPAGGTYSAFKMACLAYTPSNVNYKNLQFSRKELIEMKNRIVKSLASGEELSISETSRDPGLRTPQENIQRIRPTLSPLSTSILSPSVATNPGRLVRRGKSIV